LSSQLTFCLPSGSTKPPSTKVRVVVSNSRIVTASLPPFDSETRQRVSSGGRQPAPLNTQLAFSALDRASMSRIVSHCGSAVR
jgi:hypothetical protein